MRAVTRIVGEDEPFQVVRLPVTPVEHMHGCAIKAHSCQDALVRYCDRHRWVTVVSSIEDAGAHLTALIRPGDSRSECLRILVSPHHKQDRRYELLIFAVEFPKPSADFTDW